MKGSAEIRDWLDRWAADRGAAPALTDAHGTLSYRGLRDAVGDMAAALQNVGIGPGTRVLVLPDISAASAVTYWALRSLGAAVAVGDPGAKEPERAHFLNRTGARFLLQGRRASTSGLAPPAGVGVLSLSEAAPPRWSVEGAADAAPADASEIAVVLFSSGTTGAPKAICHSHSSIAALHRTLAATWALGDSDVVLGALPFHTIYGLLFSAGSAIWAGAHLVLMDRFHPEGALAAIERQRVTTAAMVPAMLLKMLGVEGGGRYDLSSLQMVYSASAPIAEADIDRFAAFSGAEVLSNYGMTEIPGAVVERRGRGHRRGAAGQVSPGFAAVALDEGLRPCPSGVTGEIALQGPSAMLGYLDRPEMTAKRVRQGWVLTEDLGHVDAEGFVHLSGRRSDMILRGGLNLSPIEIAGALAEHPSVEDAAVVGLPDPVLGQIPVAVVVPAGADRTGLADTLLAHCRARLSKPKVPARIVFRAGLPRNEGGKVLATVLIEEILAGVEAKP